MGAFGIVVIAVLVSGILVGALLLRRPNPWDEIGAGGFGDRPAVRPDDERPERAPSTVDDEAELRALLARKRAARRAREGLPPEADAEPPAVGPPWAHIDPELVDEARALVARRRERLSRQGKADIDEHEELTRILGPPHA
ncbi:MAG: hypothetical protein PGN13_09265 [Patulibacter minatonensis]